MSYLEFLRQWYNLAFLMVGVAGLACSIWSRLADRNLFRPTVGLIVAAVTGLTWNGAIHDLGLGSPEPRFPLVVVVSGAAGLLAAAGVGRLRDRYFRPISSVRFNRPGHEGAEARVVTREVRSEPGSGRAQWQDSDGVLHVVHVHTEGEFLGFGRRVILGPFDPESESYPAHPVERSRRG